MSFSPLCVIIHQTAVQDDLLFVRRQSTDVEQQIRHITVFPDHLGGNVLPAGGDGFPDAGDKDAVAVFVGEVGALVQGKGQDAPVDAV